MPKQPNPSSRSGRRSAALWIVGLSLVASLCATGQAQALSCAVDTGPVSFGIYDPKSALPKTSASGYIDINCTCDILVDCLAFGYTVELQGSSANRQMTRSGGSEKLNYSLAKDLLGTPFGGGSSGVTAIYLLNLFGTSQRVPLYGSIPAGQSVRVGDYVDTLGVVVTY